MIRVFTLSQIYANGLAYDFFRILLAPLESPLQGWEHRNLKKEWAKARRIRRVGMKKALEIAGIELEGPHHRALADVLNIAKLYADEERNTSNAVPGSLAYRSTPSA